MFAITLLPKRRGLVMHKYLCPSTSTAFKISSKSNVLSTKTGSRQFPCMIQKALCCLNIVPYPHSFPRISNITYSYNLSYHKKTANTIFLYQSIRLRRLQRLQLKPHFLYFILFHSPFLRFNKILPLPSFHIAVPFSAQKDAAFPLQNERHSLIHR